MELPSSGNSASQAIQQAEIILKLYEVQRKPVMQQTRGFIGGTFLPSAKRREVQTRIPCPIVGGRFCFAGECQDSAFRLRSSGLGNWERDSTRYKVGV